MKQYLSVLIGSVCICVFLSCNASQKTNIETNIERKEIINEKDHTLFDNLLLSSNFDFPNDINKKNIYTSFDNIDNNNMYTYRVYFETDGTGTLGWVKYDLNCNVLYDISGDIGTLPRILTFNRNESELFRNTTAAEAILDRIVHTAIRFDLKGESRRKNK